MAYNYRQINYEVMADTKHCYESIPELVESVRHSIDKQYMISQEESIELSIPEKVNTKYIVSGKRSFEAAKEYADALAENAELY